MPKTKVGKPRPLKDRPSYFVVRQMKKDAA